VSAEAVFPSGDEVNALLGAFLNSDCPSDPADAHCPFCGQHYRSDLSNLSSSLVYTEAEAEAEAGGGGGGGVRAARFMSYHAPLRTQTDFIEALEYAYKLAEDMSTVLGLTVTPYSVFYVFFEQYVGMEEAAMRVSALGLAAVFVIVGVLLRCRSSALLVLLSVVGVEVSVVGAMGVLGIKLNALSTVNLVAGIGIAVEFSVHVVHAFASAHGSREERALHAMRGVGGAVVSGIAVTKLLGVCVLAMATSRIFVVYYFRMYLALVIAGCFYGLVVLPVMLSIFGPLNTSAGTPSSPPIKTAELTKAEPEKDETS
jgi:Niemann-Pick C1 protein